MKKIKVVPAPWNGEKIGQKWFFWFIDPFPKNIGDKKWNGEKIGRNDYLDFVTPPPKSIGQQWKNQSCSKLPEMTR